jgi:hypothetical protein
MSVADVILLTALATALAIVLTVVGYRVIRAVVKYARELLKSVKENAAATRNAAQVVELVRGELAFMRQLTQGQVAIQPEVLPQPPLGRAGKMPPAFPQHWTTPDATPEDTDRSLLEQTEREVLEAQEREEARASGIDVDEDESLPRDAVVEQA